MEILNIVPRSRSNICLKHAPGDVQLRRGHDGEVPDVVQLAGGDQAGQLRGAEAGRGAEVEVLEAGAAGEEGGGGRARDGGGVDHAPAQPRQPDLAPGRDLVRVVELEAGEGGAAGGQQREVQAAAPQHHLHWSFK